MFRPLKRLEARHVATEALNQMAAQPDLTPEHQAVLDALQNNDQGSFHQLVMGIMDGVATGHPAAASLMDAAAAPVVPGRPHPFLDWLFKSGGLQWIYSIAQAVAAMFGWHLPPLPPIPAPPVPTPPAPVPAMALA